MFFSSCDSVVGDFLGSIKQIEAPYVFDWENAIVLHAMQGNRPHLVARGKSHGFPRVEAGTLGHSRVTTGMPILNGSLFSEVRTLV